MTRPPIPLAAVVLAAGAGTRFSSRPGAKLRAELEGRPLLDHVLRTVRTFGPVVTVVVMGHGADELQEAVDWQAEVRVVNRAPDRGLASSLQVGFDTLRALPQRVDGAFVVLGDQPRLRADVMSSLAAAARAASDPSRTIVIPDYSGYAGDDEAGPRDPYQDAAGPRNPVLILRAAWPLIDRLSGDRGMAPLIAQSQDLVMEVPVTGTNPDVDRPDDLAALASGGAPG